MLAKNTIRAVRIEKRRNFTRETYDEYAVTREKKPNGNKGNVLAYN
jgi:hypothetical protein